MFVILNCGCDKLHPKMGIYTYFRTKFGLFASVESLIKTRISAMMNNYSVTKARQYSLKTTTRTKMQTHIPMWIINEIPLLQRIWALSVMNEVTWFLFNMNAKSAEVFWAQNFSFSAWLITILKINLLDERAFVRVINSLLNNKFLFYSASSRNF